VGIAGVVIYVPPSILYSVLNPVIAGTAGKMNPVVQVFEGCVRTGATGKITTLTTLLEPQGMVPTDPAGIEPQPDARAYLAEIV
jgi:hypothetical protein